MKKILLLVLAATLVCSASHVLEAAQVMDIVLTPEEITRLEALADATGIDTRGDWEHTIESLLTITEPSHILYGSDYPYVAAPALIGAKKALEGRLAAHGLAPEDILTNNAKSLFNLQ